MPSATSTLWTGLFSVVGLSVWLISLPCFIEIFVFITNSVDPDETPRFAASELSPH